MLKLHETMELILVGLLLSLTPKAQKGKHALNLTTLEAEVTWVEEAETTLFELMYLGFLALMDTQLQDHMQKHIVHQIQTTGTSIHLARCIKSKQL